MTNFGPITLFGSGETSPGAHRIHRQVMAQFERPVQCVVIETPAGFEPNSDAVARNVGEYLSLRLQEFQPRIKIIPARKRDTAYSPDDPALTAPIFAAKYLFMGPGSPTYAARQLHESFVWYSLLAQHRRGAALVFSSASTIAASKFALPVYEIYKVGEDLHWKPGLDLFSAFGISLVVVPHWNNNDGGDDLDTSRCYMGEDRYQALAAMLPKDITILGIDENTGVIIDPNTGICRVVGAGGAIILRGDKHQHISPVQSFAVTDLGEWRLPEGSDDIPQAVWQAMQETDEQRLAHEAVGPPSEVMQLVEARETARSRREWDIADRLRDRIQQLGWQVADTQEGPHVERLT